MNEKHMTAEQVLIWLAENYANADVMMQVFGHDYLLSELLDDFRPEEVIQKIEEYEAKPKEPVIGSIKQEYGISLTPDPPETAWVDILPNVWYRNKHIQRRRSSIHGAEADLIRESDA